MNRKHLQPEEQKMPKKGGVPNVPLEQAEAETVDLLSKRVAKLENDLSDQKQNMRNIIYAVLIAAFFILLTIAVEVIIFHTRANEDVLNLQNQYFQEIKDLRKDMSQIQLDFQSSLQSMTDSKNITNELPKE